MQHPFLHKNNKVVSNNKVSDVMINISKAYAACAHVFHEYCKRQVDIAIAPRKGVYADEVLYNFVNDSVRFRLGVNTNEPNKNNVIYALNDPYIQIETLDEVLRRIMYSAYPRDVLYAFKNALESYIDDERIVDLALSKLEVAYINSNLY